MCECGETRWERWFRVGLERGLSPPAAKEHADFCEISVALHEREEALEREKERADEEAERLRAPTEIILECVRRSQSHTGECKVDDLLPEAIRSQVGMGRMEVSEATFKRALCAMIVADELEAELGPDGYVRVRMSIPF